MSLRAALMLIFHRLSPSMRRRYWALQAGTAAVAILESITLLAVAPFVALAADQSLLQDTNSLWHRLFAFSHGWGIQTPRQFTLVAGAGGILLLLGANLISAVNIRQNARFAFDAGSELSQRLFHHYLHQSWLFHTAHHSGTLTKNITEEITRITTHILQQWVLLVARLMLILSVAVVLILTDPLLSLICCIVFTIMYGLLYALVIRRLGHNSRRVSEAHRMRLSAITEGLGAIRDILILGRRQEVETRYRTGAELGASAMSSTATISLLPRCIIEFSVFTSVILYALFMGITHPGELARQMGVLSLFVLAAMKLLPASQQIYVSLSQIRGNLSAVDVLDMPSIPPPPSDPKILPNKPDLNAPVITLDQVRFTYPGKDHPALDDISLAIYPRQTVGFVGASGSGKSTCMDLILGLIQPQSGTVRTFVSGDDCHCVDNPAWQRVVGHVSQHIFLSDASIAENIALGLPVDVIDPERVRQAARMAHLDQVIQDLPRGLDTIVGERGVQLSGGQRQRIAIARALYHDPEILILDEATSALDGLSEKAVMETLADLGGQKTILIVAHRLATVKNCGRIFLFKDGRICDTGTFDELIARNPDFAAMAAHA